MPFEPGHKKHGGRAKGTPNKKTLALKPILEKLEAAGHDPVTDIMAHLDELEARDRIMVNLDLLQYIYPKKKAVETSLDPATLDRLERIKEVEAMTEEEKLEIAKKFAQTKLNSTE